MTCHAPRSVEYQVVALRRGGGPEVAEVAGGAGRLPVVVARRRQDRPVQDPAPGRRVAARELGRRAVVVGVVAGGEDRARLVEEQVGGRLAPSVRTSAMSPAPVRTTSAAGRTGSGPIGPPTARPWTAATSEPPPDASPTGSPTADGATAPVDGRRPRSTGPAEQRPRRRPAGRASRRRRRRAAPAWRAARGSVSFRQRTGEATRG